MLRKSPTERWGLIFSIMTAIHILFLLNNETHVYKCIWEDLYYGERTVKEVSSIYIKTNMVVEDLRKNYPQ